MWMTNNTAFLECSNQHELSMVMVMISLMNPFIETSFASMFTAILYVLTSSSEACS